MYLISDTMKLFVWHTLAAFDHNGSQKTLITLKQSRGCQGAKTFNKIVT